jgi:hypothetical protein
VGINKSLGIILLADVGLPGMQQGIWRTITEVNNGNKVTLGVDYTLIRSDVMISTLARLQNIGVSVRVHEFKLISSDFLEDIRSFGWRFEKNIEILLADDDGISFLDLDEIVLISNDVDTSIFHSKVKVEILDKGAFGMFNESLILMQERNYYSKYFVIRDLLLSAVIQKEFKTCFCLDDYFHTLKESVELDPSSCKEKVK